MFSGSGAPCSASATYEMHTCWVQPSRKLLGRSRCTPRGTPRAFQVREGVPYDLSIIEGSRIAAAPPGSCWRRGSIMTRSFTYWLGRHGYRTSFSSVAAASASAAAGCARSQSTVDSKTSSSGARSMSASSRSRMKRSGMRRNVEPARHCANSFRTTFIAAFSSVVML